jgi:hypothetical protein
MIRSVKSGEPGSWTAVGGGVSDSLVYSLCLDPKSPVGNRTLYCTTMGDVARSLDDGQTWSLIWDRFTAGTRTYDPQSACPAGVCPKDTRDSSAICLGAIATDGALWVGGPDGLYRCASPRTATQASDFAQTQPINWTLRTGAGASPDFRYQGVHDIVCRPEGVYVVISGMGVARIGTTSADSAGTYFTPNNGTSWFKLHQGKFDDRFVVGPNGEWWIGSRSVGGSGGITLGEGLQMSRSRLMTTPGAWTAAQSTQWQQVTGTLPWPSIGPMLVGPEQDYLMVGIPGGGFYRTDTPTSGAFAP